MKYLKMILLAVLISCKSATYNNGVIQYAPVTFTSEEKKTVYEYIVNLNKRYDPDYHMITKEINDWNYHKDALSGTFHDVRGSLLYAAALMDSSDPQYYERALDIIETSLNIQNTVETSVSRDIWPYYPEEPLSTQKSPIDYNWSDFNVVSLLDIYLNHKDRISAGLAQKIENALELAAGAIQRRNIGPGYTNIVIMGTYVTFITSHLLDIPSMKTYAKNKPKNFYDYTLEKKGFSEYNSPTYTIVALDELERMQRHIIEKESKAMIDYLYSIGWEIIARHFHKPSAQWTGPHSRAYGTLASTSFYTILYEASGGKINVGRKASARRDVKARHHIPDHLLTYFSNPVYSRVETNIFENETPSIIGKAYLTDHYAFSSVYRSSMWHQRCPFLVHWRKPEHPYYLRVCFLHDNYDFSSATRFSTQQKNKLLAGINFVTDGGDKHIGIDRLKEWKFKAKNLRLRFEIGNYNEVGEITLPSDKDNTFWFTIDAITFRFHLFHAAFDRMAGYWEKRNSQKNCWIDYVIYSGEETDIDMTKINKVAFVFTFSVVSENETNSKDTAKYRLNDNLLEVEWGEMEVAIPLKPQNKTKNL